jgi:hypothetical protein
MKTIYYLFVFAFAQIAWAGEILQPQIAGAVNIGIYSPMGQTFTAEDSRISTIGFDVWEGTFGGPPEALTYNLLQGAGIGGDLLGSGSITLSNNFSGYADVNFSSVTLTVGQVYTVLLSEPSDTYVVDRNFLSALPGYINYKGGDAIEQGLIQPGTDLTFRIEPLPEPGVLALSTAGFIALGARLRSKGLKR